MAPGCVAQLAEPISETGRGIRFAEMRHQKCFDADRRGRLDDRAQFGMQRNLKVRLFAAVGLALIDDEKIARNALASELDHIAATLPGIKQQGEGESCFATDRISRLEPLDLRFRPCPVSSGLHFSRVTPSVGSSG